jgi:hypothetical protein
LLLGLSCGILFSSKAALILEMRVGIAPKLTASAFSFSIPRIIAQVFYL